MTPAGEEVLVKILNEISDKLKRIAISLEVLTEYNEDEHCYNFQKR